MKNTFSGLYKVDLVESEPGYGKKVIDEVYFETETEAKFFVRQHNKDLPAGEIQGYYIQAHGPVRVE